MSNAKPIPETQGPLTQGKKKIYNLNLKKIHLKL